MTCPKGRYFFFTCSHLFLMDQGPIIFIELPCLSVCVFVCLPRRKTPTSGCRGDFWSKNVFLILACDDTISKLHYFPRLLKRAVLDQPFVDMDGVSRGRFVAVAVGCLHFNGTSTALQRHYNRPFHGTSMALPWHYHGT